jgi:hypothetical protein
MLAGPVFYWKPVCLADFENKLKALNIMGRGYALLNFDQGGV